MSEFERDITSHRQATDDRAVDLQFVQQWRQGDMQRHEFACHIGLPVPTSQSGLQLRPVGNGDQEALIFRV